MSCVFISTHLTHTRIALYAIRDRGSCFARGRAIGSLLLDLDFSDFSRPGLPALDSTSWYRAASSSPAASMAISFRAVEDALEDALEDATDTTGGAGCRELART